MGRMADGMSGLTQRRPLVADPRILKVLGHPLRFKIFSKLGDRPWSATELEGDLDIAYEQVRDHIRVLEKAALVERVGYEPSPRGGRRTLYRAVRLYFTAEQWASFPDAIRESGSFAYVELLTQDVLDALRCGNMETREDRVLLRRPLWTDDEGAKEIEEIMVRADREVSEVDRRSLERRNEGAPAVRLVTAFLSFPEAERGGGIYP